MTLAANVLPPAGVLVVHGIGAQQPGETARKLLAGLARVDRSVDPAAPGGAVTFGGRPLRIYEVYWADVLSGATARGAFLINELQSVSWFPWLNYRCGHYPRGHYSYLTLVWWWTVLPLVNFLALFAYYGARLVSQIFTPRRHREEKTADATLWESARTAAAETAGPGAADALLDEYVGDVFSYVNSAATAFHREGDEAPAPAAAARAYEHIVQRFYDRLLEAHADGCTAVHVVAHSLGTVVAYHALTGLRFDAGRADGDAIRAAMRTVRRLYTIGSPLEKIRFFWPRLIPQQPAFGAPAFTWDNFVSWFDPVAGTLKRFDTGATVSNHRLLGGGFVRGHVVYEHSPVFLRVLARGLCGKDLPFVRTPKEIWSDRLILLAETLLAPVAIGLILLLGASLFVMTALLLPYLLSLVLRLFLPEATWVSIQNITALVFIGLMLLAFVVGPKIRAGKVHRLYWSAARSSGTD